MHNTVKIASDEMTVELLNAISEEIQSVLEKFGKDDLEESLKRILYNQNQQDERLEDIDVILENTQNVMKKLDKDNLKEALELIFYTQDQQNEKLKEISKENDVHFRSMTNGTQTYKDDILGLQNTLNVMIEKQILLIEKISTMEENQNKPWYKKIMGGS